MALSLDHPQRQTGWRGSPSELAIPLRQWIQGMAVTGEVQEATTTAVCGVKHERELLMKCTVAYGIAELLIFAMSNSKCNFDIADEPSISGSNEVSYEGFCNIDNFSVRATCTTSDSAANPPQSSLLSPDCSEIKGIEMISTSLSLEFIKHLAPDEFFEDSDGNVEEGETKGERLEVKITRLGYLRQSTNSYSQTLKSINLKGIPKENEELPDETLGSESNNEECMLCYEFGILMYELFSNRHPFQATEHPKKKNEECVTFGGKELDGKARIEHSRDAAEPLRKKTLSDLTLNEKVTRSKEDDSLKDGRILHSMPQIQTSNCVSLHSLGYPSLISLMVRNLLDCGWKENRPDDSYVSMKIASQDLRKMVRDPSRFLFDHHRRRLIFAESSSSKGTIPMPIRGSKLYGRDKEASSISESFCSVALTGASKALFIGGYSGSGKSSLVAGVEEQVCIAGGYFLSKKFDEMAGESPLSVVFSVFDSLCSMISVQESLQELELLVCRIRAIFGDHLSTLARVLPSLAMLSPELAQLTPNTNNINMQVLSFTLQLFMRVVSSKSRPMMLLLDDLQWSDGPSLGLIRSVMTDVEGCGSIFLVGCYRDNEVGPEHAMFKLVSDLKSSSVSTTTMQLDGIRKHDLNCMVSDALGIFPRLSQALSEVLHRKTKGNPLFLVEYLRSLVDHGLVKFSLREMQWSWDVEKINERDAADNVCHFLSAKMRFLPENMQFTLKAASCLGSKIDASVVACLESVNNSFTFDKLVDEGFMDANGCYRFCHDKVREAAIGLVPEEERIEFIFNLGMMLRNALNSNADGRVMPNEASNLIAPQTIKNKILVVNLINQGRHLLASREECIDIAELNIDAADTSMASSNFTAARFYADVASNLLPADNWRSHYDLSRRIYLLLGKSAYYCGSNSDQSIAALDHILSNARCLEHELDAYFMKISLLQAQHESDKAYRLCLDVLSDLGEEIPQHEELASVSEKVDNTKNELKKLSEEEILNIKEVENSHHYSLMNFYSQACYLAYFVQPKMLSFFACRVIELSLQHGLCKYSPLGLVLFAMVLNGNVVNEPQLSYRVGKLALTIISRRGYGATSAQALTHLIFYNFIAFRVEPIQSCADMLQHGFQLGMSVGDLTSAFLCGAQHIQKSLFGGANLSDLERLCKYYLKMSDQYSHPFSKMYITLFRQTISVLKKGESNDFEQPTCEVEAFNETLQVHDITQKFFLGHYGRCFFLTEKIQSSPSRSAKLNNIISSMYRGLSALRLVNKSKKKIYQEAAIKCIDDMQAAAMLSQWNYKNKAKLLEAELLSSEGNFEMAQKRYSEAIDCSRASKFIHEQGLACELAGLHFEKHKNFENALQMFAQAKDCYEKWGSQMKVDSVSEKVIAIQTLVRGR